VTPVSGRKQPPGISAAPEQASAEKAQEKTRRRAIAGSGSSFV